MKLTISGETAGGLLFTVDDVDINDIEKIVNLMTFSTEKQAIVLDKPVEITTAPLPVVAKEVPAEKKPPKEAPVKPLKAIKALTAEAFKDVKKRRDIVRVCMENGYTQLSDIVTICESFKNEVQLIGMLGDIPKAIEAAYNAVLEEDNN